MPESHVPPASYEAFEPGKEAESVDFAPGDFILTHGKGVFSFLIRFGQGLRFRGEDKHYGRWNHAAMIVSEQGELIEAVGAGVLKTNISRYSGTEYHLVRLGSLGNPRDRLQVVEFAKWSLGQRYGWLAIVSIAVSLLTGGKFTFGYDGQAICSGLVARALERTSAIFDRTPSHVMPADLARYFKVTPTDPNMPRGRVPKPRENV